MFPSQYSEDENGDDLKIGTETNMPCFKSLQNEYEYLFY